MKITYASETILPPILNDFFEQAKEELCALSHEPDKTFLLVDDLRNQIVTWLAYHQTAD
jgi:hypothetical protein